MQSLDIVVHAKDKADPRAKDTNIRAKMGKIL